LQLVEVDARPSRLVDRPVFDPLAAMPKKALREWLCRPLRAVVGAAYGLAEANGARPAVREKSLDW
jgi:hypothetical protein